MLLPATSQVGSQVRARRKQGLSWASGLQSTWQGADTWHQVTCSPPVAGSRSLWSMTTYAGGDGEARGCGSSEASGVSAPPGGHFGVPRVGALPGRGRPGGTLHNAWSLEPAGAQTLPARPALRHLIKTP